MNLRFEMSRAETSVCQCVRVCVCNVSKIK